jgi:drug/metabolite transporter (DMT)-like permease
VNLLALDRALRHRWFGLPPNIRGGFWMLLSALVFSVMAIFIKLLGARLDAFQVAFFRCLIGWLVILPFVLRRPWAAIRSDRIPLHAVRGVLGALGMFCGYYAIAHMPLADFIGLSFSRPLFTVFCAVLLLGEIVGWRRWSATAIGFAGVLVMARPGSHGFNPAALFALGEACTVAFLSTLVKRLPARETVLGILFWYGMLSSAAAFLPTVFFFWRWPTTEEWFWLFAVGALGAFAHFCYIRSFRTGEASAVVVFDYLRLPFAGFVGWAMFGELPTLWTLAGAAIIVASTLYIMRREARVARAHHSRAEVVEATAAEPTA